MSDAMARARAHFLQGIDHFEQGRLDPAAAAFEGQNVFQMVGEFTLAPGFLGADEGTVLQLAFDQQLAILVELLPFPDRLAVFHLEVGDIAHLIQPRADRRLRGAAMAAPRRTELQHHRPGQGIQRRARRRQRSLYYCRYALYELRHY